MMEVIAWIISIIGFFAALAYACIFRIPDVFLGLPSDLFRGRISGADEEGFSIPICKPYAEGLHLKMPWWTITRISREVVTRKIPEKEFQVCGATCATSDTKTGGQGGGSVKVSGVIQYRVSKTVLYRFVEVDLDALHAGLDAEIDYVIGQQLGAVADYETAVTMKPILSSAIYQRFNSLQVEKDDNGNPSGRNRTLFNRPITYAEHNYGIEILKASIDSIILPTELNEARSNEQKEKYERESQTTEWNHLMEKVRMLKTELPNLDSKEILRAIQVWQKQYPFEAKEIKIDTPDALSSLVASITAILGGNKQ
jgi:regulator of protease activity HflC (stomatin/prohibitin superfamily)